MTKNTVQYSTDIRRVNTCSVASPAHPPPSCDKQQQHCQKVNFLC